MAPPAAPTTVGIRSRPLVGVGPVTAVLKPYPAPVEAGEIRLLAPGPRLTRRRSDTPLLRTYSGKGKYKTSKNKSLRRLHVGRVQGRIPSPAWVPTRNAKGVANSAVTPVKITRILLLHLGCPPLKRLNSICHQLSASLVGSFVCLFCIYIPLHGARRAVAATKPLPLAGQRRTFLVTFPTSDQPGKS